MKTTSQDLIFGTLNAPQTEAVKAIKGPVLILAGAGSGKTRALTHRIAYLIERDVPAWQILAVTFTNKAATEMKERVKSLLHLTEGGGFESQELGIRNQDGRLPVMGTFHSICVRILRRDIERLGRDRNFVIYDSDDQEKLMKRVLKEMRIEEAELKARAALGYVGRFKCEAVGPGEAKIQATSDRMHTIVQVYARYQKTLQENSALDFDDLILETVRLFHECPQILDRYQETWRYLNVDEYQDTNHAQYLLISQLAQKYRNLCVIGDPDQSIYAFRGADIRNILEFQKEYPDAIEIKLEQNYRSTQPILSAADGIIAPNPNRPPKKMWTERSEGPHVVVHEVRDEKREAEEVVHAVEQHRKSGVALREQVILYRTHAQSRLFEEACMRSGIPYRILGGVKFYARKEVKDVLAYLYTILNPSDTVSMLRIINVPGRKLGETTLGRIQEYASTNHKTLWESLRDAADIPKIQQFVDIIERYSRRADTQVVSELADNLLNELKMERWLKEGQEAEGEERWQNVQELLTVMHKYDGLEPRTSLTSFLEEVALVSEVDKLTDGGKDALTLMTLHLCKGLEFESVNIVGCEEGLFPHSNSMFDKEQLEEERRLMYVGMTRARTHLRLLFAQNRYLWGENKSSPPSRFLDDLPESVIERRSDDILSAFAWASTSGEREAVSDRQRHPEPCLPAGRPAEGRLQPFIQNDDLNIEFDQDMTFDVEEGTRIEHPVFGQGVVITRRGDVVEIAFDNGQKKTFALSIAPLKIL